MTFDAVFAFMALWFAKTPAIREFGSLLVIGIIAVCVCSIIATLAVLGIREYKSPTHGKDFSQGRLSRIVARLGSVPKRFAPVLAVVSIIILLSGVALEGRLQLQTDPISWVNPQAQSIKNIDQLKAATGSDNELAMRISTTHPWSNATISYVAKFSRQLVSKYPHFLYPAAGLVNTIDQFITNEPGMVDVPPTGAEIEAVYRLAPEGIKKTTVANNGEALNTIFRGRTDTLTDLSPVVRDLQGGINPPAGISVAPGGIAVVGVGLIENLEKSSGAAHLLGAVVRGRLPHPPAAQLDPGTAVSRPGARGGGGGVAHRRGLPSQAEPGDGGGGSLGGGGLYRIHVADPVAFRRGTTTRALTALTPWTPPPGAQDAPFMVSGMTAVAGVGTLGLSSMPLLSEFGVIVAINVSVALVSALVVLPPILVWADERNWVTRGLIKARPQPYLTEEEQIAAAVAAGNGHAPVPVPASGYQPAPALQPTPGWAPAPQPQPQSNGGWAPAAAPGYAPPPPDPGAAPPTKPLPVPASLWHPQFAPPAPD